MTVSSLLVVAQDKCAHQWLKGLEPRKQRDERVETFVDLGATSQDHGEVDCLPEEVSFL